MFSGVKKAAAAVAQQLNPNENDRDNLGKAIQQEKYCQDLLQKLLEARKQAEQYWCNWAEEETSDTIRLLIFKLTQLDSMWIEACTDYLNQQETAREYFKHVANGERTITVHREKAEAATTRSSKLQKQVYEFNSKYNHRSSDAKKLEQMTMDLAKAKSLEEKECREFNTRQGSHVIFKHAKLRDGLKLLFSEQTALCRRSLQISEASQSVLAEFTNIPYSRSTATSVKQANDASEKIIHDLSNQSQKRSSKLEELVATGSEAIRSPGVPAPRIAEYQESVKGHDMESQPVYIGIPDEIPPEFETPAYLELDEPAPPHPRGGPPDRPLPPEPDERTYYSEVYSDKNCSVTASHECLEHDSHGFVYDNNEYRLAPPPLPEKREKVRRETSLELAEKDLAKEEAIRASLRSSTASAQQATGEDEDEYEISDDWRQSVGKDDNDLSDYSKPWV